jgi:hypothetical protein
MMRAPSSAATIALAAFLGVPTALGAPGVSVEYGDSIDADAGKAQMLQLNLSRSFGTQWQLADWLTIEPLWEASVGRIAAENVLSDSEEIWTAALQLVLSVPLTESGRVFAEGATGLAYLSEETLALDDQEDLDLGSNVLFRSQLGLGGYLDAQQRFFLVYRVQHSSHAGLLGETNPGIDFQVLQLGFRFD